ncbi:sulfotransferase [Rhodanobacter denitrificans]|uniref:tetratricopeptide repeat-containing sulfotransferase family protein n=1 Tax=Rhodanobacter TaxID=75309 RepID=UPI000260E5F9|nr:MULTISPECIES: sulfotransferase [Rhodanobacter]EIM04051.1 sulfotransferase [Rhodanobacter denitrificans]UJJ59871.1 sulfotransferase [Rhodanobacter denitrificans]UJM90549.1 sulfotransferase [Rhodanobacter denitrificans]
MVASQVHPLLRDRVAGLSPEVVRLLGEAGDAMTGGELERAAAALAAALALAPESTEALRLSAQLQQLRGEHAQAVAILREALAKDPRDAVLHISLGVALQSSGENEAALSALQRACELAPDFAPAWFNRGRMFQLLGRPAGAITALHRALDVDPGHLAARLLLASAQADLGAEVQAAANYREVLRREPGQPEAWSGLAALDAERFSSDDVARLQQVLQAPQPTPRARIQLGFALARALEDQADYRAAFRALRKANGWRHRQLNWNAASMCAHVDAMLAAFAEPLAGAADAALGEQVIFLMALPHAGAALTGQILAAHPYVGGVDESPDLQRVIGEESARRGRPLLQWIGAATPADWARLGRDYLARTAPVCRGRPRFVDAYRLNWRVAGVALAMLPGARVVHCRRDALETCFACYRQLFASGHDFSYDLDDIASYWRDHERLGRHWQRLFPQRYLEHDYEALLAEPEAQVQRLLAFCGLEVDPACLAGFRHGPAQARTALRGRQPWPREPALAARYGAELDRLRLLLGAR